MLIRSRAILSASMLLAAVSAAPGQNNGGPPNLDTRKHCQAAQSATDERVGERNATSFDSCMRSENTARERLVRDWATISAAAKAHCVQPAVFSANYMEWVSCIEMNTYVATMRKENPVAMVPSKNCPRLTWRADGSVGGADACAVLQRR